MAIGAMEKQRLNEPRRVYRRLISVSYAAMDSVSRAAWTFAPACAGGGLPRGCPSVHDAERLDHEPTIAARGYGYAGTFIQCRAEDDFWIVSTRRWMRNPAAKPKGSAVWPAIARK